jgi:hypothetical protein
MAWTRCPECRQLAAMERLTMVSRAGGDVAYATIRCVTGHWLSCPVAALPTAHDTRRAPAVAGS